MTPKVIPGDQNIPEQHTWKLHKTTNNGHIGRCTCPWESADVTVQNILPTKYHYIVTNIVTAGCLQHYIAYIYALFHVNNCKYPT
jgi:hypothetical protein